MNTAVKEAMNVPVKEIMTKHLITVIATDKLVEVDKIFKKNNIHHIPVARHQKLEGMISRTDYDKLIHGLRIRDTGNEDMENVDLLAGHTAEELMTKQVVYLHDYDKIGTAAEIFLKNYFKALPVLNKEGELVGMLTTYDVIKYFYKMAYPQETLNVMVK